MPLDQPKPAVSDYYSDFFTIPASLALAVYFFGLPAVGVLSGLTLFTLVEYWTHRVALHTIFWSQFHQRHHQHPAEYVVFPLWYTPAIIAAAWVILPHTWVAGWLLGMIWFYAWHHVLHHWNLRKPGVIRGWLRAYSDWHELHHKDLPCNYGITQPLWDFVFGTYLTRDEGRKALLEMHFKKRLKMRKPAPTGME